jgi:hypothetical protein
MSSPSDPDGDDFFKDFIDQNNRSRYELAEADTTNHENESMGLSCCEENTTSQNSNASVYESMSTGRNIVLDPEQSQAHLTYHPHPVSYNLGSVYGMDTTSIDYPFDEPYTSDSSFLQLFRHQNDATYQSTYRNPFNIDYHPPGMVNVMEGNKIWHFTND